MEKINNIYIIAGKYDRKCSNTSICATEHFCNYDYHDEGFCEKCPMFDSVLPCSLQQLLNEKGLRDCEKSCDYGSYLPSFPSKQLKYTVTLRSERLDIKIQSIIIFYFHI